MGRAVRGRARRAAIACVAVAASVLPASCGTAPAPAPSFGVPDDQLPVCGVATPDRVVALSFDGGPGPFTEQDLQLLEENGDEATFFVTAQHVLEFPRVVPDELRSGMDVENHTWSHPVMPLLPPGTQRREIEHTQEMLRAEGAPSPSLWRPPYGAIDHETLSIARSFGLRTVLWTNSVEVRVRDPIGDPRGRAEELAGLVHPGQILLAHDSIPLATTTETLRYLLPLLRRAGYDVVTVPELLAHGPAVPGHARWGTEIDGHPVMRGGCPAPWPSPPSG